MTDLEKYGVHSRVCAYGYPAGKCTCGLTEAIERAKARESRVEALEGALREAEDHLTSCCPSDGWGLLDHTADNYRRQTLEAVRAALSAGREKGDG